MGKKYLENLSRFPCFHGMPCRGNVGARQSHKFAEFQSMLSILHGEVLHITIAVIVQPSGENTLVHIDTDPNLR